MRTAHLRHFAVPRATIWPYPAARSTSASRSGLAQLIPSSKARNIFDAFPFEVIEENSPPTAFR